MAPAVDAVLAHRSAAAFPSSPSSHPFAGSLLLVLTVVLGEDCAAPHRATIADGGAWIASRPPLVVHAVQYPREHPAGRRADVVFHAEIVRQLESAGWRVIDPAESGHEPGALHLHSAVVGARARILDSVSTWDGTAESDRSGISAADGFVGRMQVHYGSRAAISLAVVVADAQGRQFYAHRFGIETIELDDDPEDDVWFRAPDRNQRAVEGVLAELLER
ncbi:MAG: hypothetical protein L6Q99_16145 [Planctomycetes bacterium]|nr:hypothetical protein [Planctomycetota bacterium]